MTNKDHQKSEVHARQAQQDRDKRRRAEQSAGWGREDFFRDLGRASRRMSEEISSDPTEAQKLRRARRQAREGKLLSDIDEDVGLSRLGAAPTPAHVSLVHLDHAAHRRAVVVLAEHGANLVVHPPSRLVGDSKVTLQLLRRDAAPRLRDEEHGVEPQDERVRRLVVDRPGRRVNVMPARVTTVGRVLAQLVEAPLALALRAEGVLAISAVVLAPEVVKARVVGRKVAQEVHDRVSAFAAACAYRLVAVDGGHA